MLRMLIKLTFSISHRIEKAPWCIWPWPRLYKRHVMRRFYANDGKQFHVQSRDNHVLGHDSKFFWTEDLFRHMISSEKELCEWRTSIKSIELSNLLAWEWNVFRHLGQKAVHSSPDPACRLPKQSLHSNSASFPHREHCRGAKNVDDI